MTCHPIDLYLFFAKSAIKLLFLFLFFVDRTIKLLLFHFKQDFFLQNNTIFQTISLVNIVFKLFRKLTSQVC